MKVAVTGADGFLGARLADALLEAQCALGTVSELVLLDVRAPPPRDDPRVSCLALDLTAPGAAESVVTPVLDVLFHLAAVVSGQAESDLDLGLSVNFDATRALLEAARRRAPALRLVFASTLGVFGGALPSVVPEGAATTPQSSYGTAKAMCELLMNDYSRRGLVDARAVRLPTVSVRAGAANAAVTSFASAIVREPLSGRTTICPVPETQRLWLCSPRVAVHNLVHAATLPAGSLGSWRAVSLPGLSASVQDILRALQTVAGTSVAARVIFKYDEAIARMVASFPAEFDNSRALALGFKVDTDFEAVIRAYIRDELKGSIQ